MKLPTVERALLVMFCRIAADKLNSKQVRLQKTRKVIDYAGAKYTVTVERGDKLNGAKP